MAVSRRQAIEDNEFHMLGAGKCDRWRRNGRTQTWKTRPDEFRIPVKFGLRNYGNITDGNAHLFHTLAECPYKEE